MLLRLVSPVKRPGSSVPQFVQRIPADVRNRAAGRRLTISLGDGERVAVRITPQTQAVRFSLRTSDPAEAKIRQGKAAAQLEEVWRALRRDMPVMLSSRQAHALAGELYRAWADERRQTNVAVTLDVATGKPIGGVERVAELSPEETALGFAAAARRLCEAAERDGLETALGPLVNRLLLRKGIAEVDPECRPTLLGAFAQALQDAFAVRERNARGDYSPDPKAQRFPEWVGEEQPGPAVSLTGLLEDWWREAKAAGRKPSTYESYRNTVAALRAFLGHDDAARVSPEDVLRFKDHRLSSVHPQTGKPISPKTVKDSDLSALKTVFGWGVVNLRLSSNPAAGITIKLAKRPRLRSKGFTEGEARTILKAASRVARTSERYPETAMAKRWVPWLCAFTGARVGEMAQLRKEDLRREGELWVLRITPEAGPVKTNDAREVVLHAQLVEEGFPAFVNTAPSPYLFLKPAKGTGDVRGPLRGIKNRLQEFVRTVVTDRNVAPNHGWRHRFKTVGMEAGIPPRILDAIQGQAPASVADSYGEVTLRTQAAAIAKMPRIEV